MHFIDGKWEVNISPDFAIGLHFPHVRIRLLPADGSPPLVYDSGHLSPVATADEARFIAKKLAQEWISCHSAGQASPEEAASFELAKLQP